MFSKNSSATDAPYRRGGLKSQRAGYGLNKHRGQMQTIPKLSSRQEIEILFTNYLILIEIICLQISPNTEAYKETVKVYWHLHSLKELL